MNKLKKLKESLIILDEQSREVFKKVSEVQNKIALEACPFNVGDDIECDDVKYRITSIHYNDNRFLTANDYILHGKIIRRNGILHEVYSKIWNWNASPIMLIKASDNS